MNHFYDREFLDIKVGLSRMSTLVTGMIDEVEALFLGEGDPARVSIKRDEKEVNTLDQELYTQCVKLLTLYAPKSSQLRYVVEATHIIIYLERIGDHCKKMAKIFVKKELEVPKEIRSDLKQLFKYIKRLPSQALEAFFSADTAGASKINENDSAINELRITIDTTLIGLMKEDSEKIENHFFLAGAVKRLERIADHTGSIAASAYFFNNGTYSDQKDDN